MKAWKFTAILSLFLTVVANVVNHDELQKVGAATPTLFATNIVITLFYWVILYGMYNLIRLVDGGKK